MASKIDRIGKANASAAAPLAPKLRERIQEALSESGRPGVRKIAERFGVNASTVQQISNAKYGAPHLAQINR